MTKGTKRESMSISLQPDIAKTLKQESAARMVGTSLLVEKALEMYLPTLPPVPDTAMRGAVSENAE